MIHFIHCCHQRGRCENCSAVIPSRYWHANVFF